MTQANFIENVSKILHLFNYDYDNNDVPYLLERKNEFLDIKNKNVKKKKQVNDVLCLQNTTVTAYRSRWT